MQRIYHRTIHDDRISIVDSSKKGSWVIISEPNSDELSRVAKTFSLDKDLLDDGIDLYEAPRLEREDGVVYIYTRYCRPAGEYTSTHPILIVVTKDTVLTISRADCEPLEALINKGEIITTQKMRLVLEILGEINKGFRVHLNEVTKRILSTRNKLQRTVISNPEVLNFIDMEEDLNEFLAALQPYGLVLQALLSGRYIAVNDRDEDLVEDLQLSTDELIDLTKSRLSTIQNIRDAYSTIATNNLNQLFKRLTSIAIFMTIPTIIGGLYGMNIALPFDHHPQAFWLVLGSITLIVSLFVTYFHKSKWL